MSAFTEETLPTAENESVNNQEYLEQEPDDDIEFLDNSDVLDIVRRIKDLPVKAIYEKKFLGRGDIEVTWLYVPCSMPAYTGMSFRTGALEIAGYVATKVTSKGISLGNIGVMKQTFTMDDVVVR